MKTKTLVIGIAALMMGLASCSNNEELNIPNQDGMIGFNIATNKAITRSPINGATDMQSMGFDVWGYRQNDSHQQVGTDGNPVVATYSGSAWNLATPAYWPADASQNVNFYAIWPTGHYETATSIAAAAQTVKYTRKSTESDVKDLMYAKKITSKTAAASAGSKVMLYFKHALSQVSFKGKTAAPGLEVKVKSLQLCNLANEGTFTFPSSETAASSSHGTWTDPKNPGTDFIPTMSSEVTLSSTTTSEALGAPLLLLPQSFTPWSTTASAKKSIAEADAANESYLKLEVHITQNGEDILGTASVYAETYIPLPKPTTDIEFKSGKKYTYTLKFGGGKKGDGDDQFAPIEFDVDVDPWGDASEENMDL